MITSCETSTSRRVRYPESAVRSAVSARPLRAPCVAMKYSSTDRPSRKFDLIGRGMISPLGLATRPRMPGDLPHLHHVSAGAGRDHHVDRVAPREVALHRPRDLVRRLGPDLDELLATLVVGDQAALVLLLDLLRLALVLVEDLLLARRGDHVADRDRDAGPGRPAEARLLERVERGRHLHLGVALGEVVDDRPTAASCRPPR